MVRAAEESGATVVDTHFHEFAPQGISGVVVIKESHFAIHTWPEHGFAAVDVFTCGRSVDVERAIAILKEGFGASLASITHHLDRGSLPIPAEAAIARARDVGTGTDTEPSAWRARFERERPGNVSVLVDLHGCRGSSESHVRGARAFLLSAAALLGLDENEREPTVRVRDDALSFGLVGQATTIAGRVAGPLERVYVSVLSGRFVEPRALAHSALHHFAGTHCGLQVGMQL